MEDMNKRHLGIRLKPGRDRKTERTLHAVPAFQIEFLRQMVPRNSLGFDVPPAAAVALGCKPSPDWRVTCWKCDEVRKALHSRSLPAASPSRELPLRCFIRVSLLMTSIARELSLVLHLTCVLQVKLYLAQGGGMTGVTDLPLATTGLAGFAWLGRTCVKKSLLPANGVVQHNVLVARQGDFDRLRRGRKW
jgi:hypothetical protein